MASNASEDAAPTAKCFSAILNRLLCSGTPPTHPSDDHLPQLTSTTESTHQPNVSKPESAKPIQTPPSTPSIVARLMGLDPFPDITPLPKRRTLESILRSKSVSYVDYYMPQLDFSKQVQFQAHAQSEARDQAHHRRVRTSVSFREVPTFLLPQNHDLLLLCLDQVDEITKKHELRLKDMTSGKINGSGRREKEEKHKTSCKRKEEEPKPNKVTNRPSPKPKVGSVSDHNRDVKAKHKAGNILDQKRNVQAKPSTSLNGPKSPVKPTSERKEVSVGKKRNGNNQKQNSISKVSYGMLGSTTPGSENSEQRKSRSRKIFSARYNKYNHPCPNFTSRMKEDVEEQKTFVSKTNKLLKTEARDYTVIDILKEVCRLAEEDTKIGSVCLSRNGFRYEDLEEICFEFERETLEKLLYQVVDELCNSSQEYLWLKY